MSAALAKTEMPRPEIHREVHRGGDARLVGSATMSVAMAAAIPADDHPARGPNRTLGQGRFVLLHARLLCRKGPRVDLRPPNRSLEEREIVVCFR
jgi:hypothetical protein